MIDVQEELLLMCASEVVFSISLSILFFRSMLVVGSSTAMFPLRAETVRDAPLGGGSLEHSHSHKQDGRFSMLKPGVESTAVVIVTYGERACILSDVVAAVLGCGLLNITIVDNGSPATNAAKIDALAVANPGAIQVVRLAENRGSAGGFHVGMKAAFEQSSVKYLWILDDDNKPAPDAFEQLMLAYARLGDQPKNILVSLRPDRKEYTDAARTGMHEGIRAGSFLGYRFGERFSVNRGLGDNTSPGNNEFIPLVQLAYAPYGGLFFDKQWLYKSGFPNEKFYLYSDDHEFTMRMKERGAILYLCSSSVVEDLESAWGGDGQSPVPVVFREGVEDKKIFCYVRNRAYLENRAHGMPFVYWLSATVVVGSSAVKALLLGSSPRTIISRLALIKRAISAGRVGDFSTQ